MSMKLSHGIGYSLLVLAAVAPVALRLVTWQMPRHHAVDATEADAGKVLFNHEWVPNDPLSPGGDGLGPVYNASSCIACHNQGGPGGGGDLQHNVTMFTVLTGVPGESVRVGVVHARAVKYQETLAQVAPGLPAVSRPPLADLLAQPNGGPRRITFPSGVMIAQRNTPALFGAKWIDELSDQAIIANERSEQLQWGLTQSKSDDVTVGRAPRLPNGGVGRFGWKAQTASLAEFVQAACANELGLGNPGQAQPRPLGKPDYKAPGLDLTSEQCNQLSTFILSLPRPVERQPEDAVGRSRAEAGKQVFHSVGCADCHVPDVGSVKGIYSDLLLHRMGLDLEGGGYYGDPVLTTASSVGGPEPAEWRTPPLWGVADSAPYLHDGRAATLEEAIKMHGGQGSAAARRFDRLGADERGQLVAFLKTLRAP
jgi:CxxC motif-containing protein (DUF1111 family)